MTFFKEDATTSKHDFITTERHNYQTWLYNNRTLLKINITSTKHDIMTKQERQNYQTWRCLHFTLMIQASYKTNFPEQANNRLLFIVDKLFLQHMLSFHMKQ